ncbi:MAG: NADH-quinone oxidoreductase subunit J [Planctomycetota bacterium]|nr:NADH-quinone oxidoreductase subunit J [Planctomycetota bacterium]
MMNLIAVAWEYWHQFFFILFAVSAIGFGFGVLLSKNVVRMAFYLVLSLGATAGLFFLAGAEFVGAMQLMIYVGGTMVLLIFGVMLTAQKDFINMDTHTQDWILATIVGGSLLMVLLFAAFGAEDWSKPQNLTDAKVEATKEATPLGLALTGIRVDTLGDSGDAVEEGKAGYLMPFIIVSIHLLVVLIGAAYMARTKKLSHATDDKSSRAKLMLFKMEQETEPLEEETYVVTHRGQSALNPLDSQDEL